MPYNTSTVLAERSYDIADVSLAPEGTKRIQWAKAHMPIMSSIIERMEQQKPFKDLTIGVCLHVEAKTGVWMEALTKGGATVALTGSPGSTQDETAAALVKDYGVHVFSHRNETFEDHMEYCKQILRFKPDIIADNGRICMS